MAGLPTGTVTFLFTDLEGSTRLWEEHPEAMKSALARHDEIVRSAATSELARGTTAELTDLGEHRLRDLSRAERVVQLCPRGLPREFPPLRSLDVYPGNLPLQLTSFVGRERDLDEVAAALREH